MKHRTHVVGYIGEILLSISLIPLLYTVLKTKDVDSFDSTFLIMVLIGLIFRLKYSSDKKITPVTVSCIGQLVVYGIICILKFS